MGVLADHQIRARLSLPDADPKHLRISPFAEATKTPGRVSHGLQSYGYDLRLGASFAEYGHHGGDTIDLGADGPLHKPLSWRRSDKFVLPPQGFVLAQSLEAFHVPRDVSARVVGKSTWARCGINLNTTILEPQWQGAITLEIANLGPLPVVLYAGWGIGQVVFDLADEVCERSYADKAFSLYQGQTGPTAPRV